MGLWALIWAGLSFRLLCGLLCQLCESHFYCSNFEIRACLDLFLPRERSVRRERSFLCSLVDSAGATRWRFSPEKCRSFASVCVPRGCLLLSSYACCFVWLDFLRFDVYLVFSCSSVLIELLLTRSGGGISTVSSWFVWFLPSLYLGHVDLFMWFSLFFELWFVAGLFCRYLAATVDLWISIRFVLVDLEVSSTVSLFFCLFELDSVEQK